MEFFYLYKDRFSFVSFSMKNIAASLITLYYSQFLYAQDAPGIEGQTPFGGSEDGKHYSIELTADGGCIIAGYSKSTDGNCSSSLQSLMENCLKKFFCIKNSSQDHSSFISKWKLQFSHSRYLFSDRL